MYFVSRTPRHELIKVGEGSGLPRRNYLKRKLLKGFYENGNVSELTNLKNGFLNGVSERFYENGNVMWHERFKMEKPIGLSIFFTSMGTPKRIHFYF